MSGTRSIWLTWLALLLLAGLTFGLSFLPLDGFSAPVALLIAIVKGALVVFIFMEMLGARVSSRLALTCALLLLATLLLLASADVLTREIAALPPP